MGKHDNVYEAWTKFCNEQECCEKCQYGDDMHCATSYAYDSGIKFAFDAAVNLLGAYQKEDKHDRN